MKPVYHFKFTHINLFKEGLKCSKCRTFSLEKIRHSRIQCSTCMHSFDLFELSREYFYYYLKLFPYEEFTKKKILFHLQYDLSRYMYEQLISSQFVKKNEKSKTYLFNPGRESAHGVQ